MSQFTRRRLVGSTVGSAALAGAMAIGSAQVVGAAPKTGLTPAVISAQDKPIEITFAHIWGTPQGEAPAATKHPAELVIDAFNAQSTTVKVTSRTDPGGYYTNLQKAQAELAAGKPPAMVITPWSNINYASEGLGIIDLEDIAGDDVAPVFANFMDQVIPLVQIDGKTKGLPYAFSCPTVYYNADILKRGGGGSGRPVQDVGELPAGSSKGSGSAGWQPSDGLPWRSSVAGAEHHPIQRWPRAERRR